MANHRKTLAGLTLDMHTAVVDETEAIIGRTEVLAAARALEYALDLIDYRQEESAEILQLRRSANRWAIASAFLAIAFLAALAW